MKNIKKILIASVSLLSTHVLFAQDTIQSKIEGWTTTLKTVLNAGVAAFAIVGGFLIFVQYMQGNESAQKNFIRFVIGLAIFGLVDLIANVFV